VKNSAIHVTKKIVEEKIKSASQHMLFKKSKLENGGERKRKTDREGSKKLYRRRKQSKDVGKVNLEKKKGRRKKTCQGRTTKCWKNEDMEILDQYS
jgi:hypothetical protein